MLDSALHYRRAFEELDKCDEGYKHCPTKQEWDRVDKICEFLGVFYNVTCTFSGTKYPTSNLYFPQVFLVHHALSKAIGGEDPFMIKMASQMKIKFEKYWAKHNLIFVFSVVLDPRYKLQFVEYCYKLIYGDDSMELKNVREKLDELFDTYVKTYSKATESSNSVQPTNNVVISSSAKRGMDVLEVCLVVITCITFHHSFHIVNFILFVLFFK